MCIPYMNSWSSFKCDWLIDWLTDWWVFCAFYYAVDFVLKDPREKDDDKKEEVLEHKKE